MRCLVFSLASSASRDRRHRCAQIWPQMFTNLWCAQHSFAPLRPHSRFCTNHRCRLYSLPSLHYCADHTKRVDSFVSKFWTDRLSRTICSSQSADSQLAAFNLHKLTLRPTTLGTPTGLQLRNQFVAGVPTGRSLARRPPAAAGMAARPGDNLRLPPALLASTCRLPPTDVRVHHKVTRLPQSGCSHRALRQQFTRTVADNAGKRIPRRERTTTTIPRRIQH